MEEELFINEIPDVDYYYQIIRDEKSAIDLKNYVNNLWKVYRPYADRDFQRQLAQDFHARFWEMYLTCMLIYMSKNVIPKQNKSIGPDIIINESSNRIFIEAITPSEGAVNNLDKVPKFRCNTPMQMPDDEIILRYTSAITEKHSKYLSYINQGIISSSDSYIIAINSCKIETATNIMTIPNDLPRIVKSVLPIGYKQVTISNSLSCNSVTWRYQYRPNIYRFSGSSVPTDIFLRDEYAGISGILYSHSDVANLQDDFIFIHNPKSIQNAVPDGYFKFGFEIFVELKQESFSITWKEWRKNNGIPPYHNSDENVY